MFHPEESPTLSPEEFDERLRGISKADSIRLKMIAKVYAKRCSHGPDDLIQEAVTRTLEGNRRCPRHVEVVPFLTQVMRSLSSDENKALDRKPDLLSLSSLTDTGFDLPDHSPTPEEQCHSQQGFKDLWDEVRGVFHDDELAVDILEYLVAGYEADEIRKDLKMDQTTYNSKRKLIRRRLDRHFTQGGRA